MQIQAARSGIPCFRTLSRELRCRRSFALAVAVNWRAPVSANFEVQCKFSVMYMYSSGHTSAVSKDDKGKAESTEIPVSDHLTSP